MSNAAPRLATPLDLSAAGWLLAAACAWELAASRLMGALGLYQGTTWWPSSVLAATGRLAVNVVGIVSLVLAAVAIPRLTANPRLGALGFRLVLMLLAPLVLPVICVSVFRPVSPWLVFLCYLVAVLTAAYVAVLAATRPVPWTRRRVLLALALAEILCAFELTARVLDLLRSSGWTDVIPRRAYLFAEVVFVATPVFAFFALREGGLRGIVRRPRWLALVLALAVTAVAVAAAAGSGGGARLALAAFRTLGLTLSVPGGAPLYIAALFLGAWLVFSLVLPSRREPADQDSRRFGLGLLFVWSAGLQPTHPYQIILMLVGFLMLGRGAVGEGIPAQRAG